MRFATYHDLALVARLNKRFAEFVLFGLRRRHRLVTRSQRRVARMMIQGWAPVTTLRDHR